MRVPRVRLTVRQMMVLVAIAALVLLASLRILERQRRLDRAARARYAAALARHKVAEKLFMEGETNFRDFYSSARILAEAQRETGDRAWASDHLKRIKSIKQLLLSTINIEPIPRMAMADLDYAVKEAEYWALQSSW